MIDTTLDWIGTCLVSHRPALIHSSLDCALLCFRSKETVLNDFHKVLKQQMQCISKTPIWNIEWGRVMSLGRPEMQTFSSVNLDGSCSTPPAPPSPSTPSPCYDDCEKDMHCSDCGKCYALCPEHSGCNCGDEDGLEFTFHCAVCCCGRSLEHEECKLRSLLSPEDYHTASHPYLWYISCCDHSQ